MNKDLRYLSYARKSSQGESRQIESIPDQEKVLREVCDRFDLDVGTWLSESKRASLPDVRPVFRGMLNSIYAGEANAILCWHVDRLSRNPKESGELQQMLQDGVIQCIKTPEREYHPEDHGLLFAIESSTAAQQTRDLKRNVGRGVREKAEKGWYPYRPKAGYQVAEFTKEVVPDPARFPLLRRAVEIMLSGDKSVPVVLTALNALGYRTPRTKNGGNKPMNRSGLYRFFTDPYYCGIFAFGDREIEGRHEPLLSVEEFDRIQQILGRPTRSKPQRFFHRYAGLIRCGVCGCLITAETHVKYYKTTDTTRSYTYYHCTGRKGCRKLSVTEDELEEQIRVRLEGCQLDRRFADWALGVLKRTEESTKLLATSTESTTSSAKTTLERKIDRLFTMRENQEIRSEEFIQRKNRYEEELRNLRKEDRWQANKQERDRESLHSLLRFSRDGYARFIQGRPEEKRTVARAFSREYVLTQGTLRIATHPGLDRIRTFEPPKNQPQQVSPDGAGVVSPYWRAMWDELRKIVAASDIPFDTPPRNVPEQRLAA